VPGEAGLAVQLEYVYEAAALSASTDEPGEFPQWFHEKLLYLVSAIYCETVEDNQELAEAKRAEFDAAVGELVRFDNERQAGEGLFQVPVLGVTA